MVHINIEFMDLDDLPCEFNKLLNAISDFYYSQQNTLAYNYYSENKYINEKCAICLEKFTNNDLVCDITCKHTFHKKCIKIWAKHKDSCPLCKRDLINNRKIKFSVEMLI